MAQALPGVELFPANTWDPISTTMDISVSAAPPGARFSLVASVIEVKDGICCCAGISPKQTFYVAGASHLALGFFTFYDVVRSETDDTCHVVQGRSEALLHQPKGEFHHVLVLDLCAGMGGFSIGSQLLGMQTAVMADHSPLACEALKANFSCPCCGGRHPRHCNPEADSCLERVRFSPAHRRFSLSRFFAAG